MSSKNSDQIINLKEIMDNVKQRLTEEQFCYIEPDDGQTKQNNILAFDKYKIVPDYLSRPVDNLDTTVTLLNGRLTLPSPICVAPFGLRENGPSVLELARGCLQRGTPYVQSWGVPISVADVRKNTGARIWYNVNLFKDRNFTLGQVKLAESAGVEAIVVTVDAAKYNVDLTKRNIYLKSLPHLAGYFQDSPATPYATWNDLKWLTERTKLPVIVKGVLTGWLVIGLARNTKPRKPSRNARQAVQSGASAIIVSNHGGRLLDGMPAAVDCLPEVVDAVMGQVDVYFDSGIRSGLHVFKALALGAKMVLIGRPILYGLEYSGELGVRTVLNTFESELKSAMMIAGCPRVSDICRDNVKVFDAKL